MVMAGRAGQSDRLGVWDEHVHIVLLKIDNQESPTEETNKQIKNDKELMPLWIHSEFGVVTENSGIPWWLRG